VWGPGLLPAGALEKIGEWAAVGVQASASSLSLPIAINIYTARSPLPPPSGPHPNVS
jgi:hypothetical protein